MVRLEVADERQPYRSTFIMSECMSTAAPRDAYMTHFGDE